MVSAYMHTLFHFVREATSVGVMKQSATKNLYRYLSIEMSRLRFTPLDMRWVIRRT